MKVSLNAIRELTGLELPPVEELVAKINSQLGGVEEVTDLGAKYKDAKIVNIVECEKHPDADRLSVCKIDAGGGELIQVVCGAPNVHAGMWAIWLPPGSIVPSTFDDAEPFTLGARELRGVMSNGMLAAGDELAINSDHEGIIELTESDVNLGGSLVSGASFAETFGLDDVVIDIENKMFTHRPDLFGQLGVAREISAILGQTFEDPSWYYELSDAQETSSSELPLTVFNEAGDKAPRFMTVPMSGVSVRPSPMWLQTTLLRWGGKPINNVVDITNYVMLLTAQPTHAYDYAKLREQTLGVRMAHHGEKLTLLNGKSYELQAEDIVIADGAGPVGLAGIMGGSDSEVDDATKDIVLEVANFDMYAVRRSSMRHGLFTDALTRFNKGQSMLMCPYVLQHMMTIMAEITGAKHAGEIHDDLMQDGTTWRTNPAVKPMLKPDKISACFINKRLGLALTPNEISELLTRVGFECEQTEESISYWSPAWRMDIQDLEDVVEEVGRLYGFDKLPRELPTRSIRPAATNPKIEMKRKIGQILSVSGANEVKTYSFVHERVLKNAGQNPEHAFKLSNALSPDLQYYRLSLMPSLLDKVHMNIKAGHDEFALYEFGKAHNLQETSSGEDGLPKELNALAFIYASKKASPSAAYYTAKRYLDRLLAENSLDTAIVFEPLENADLYGNQWLEDVTAAYDPKRSAVLRAVGGQLEGTKGLIWGVVGEFKPQVKKAFKLPESCAGFELDPLMFVGADSRLYRPLSRFPHVTQDISLKVDKDVPYADIYAVAQEAIRTERSQNMSLELTPLGIYAPESSDTKTITLRLTATNYERTLTDSIVTKYIDQIAAQAADKLQAEKV